MPDYEIKGWIRGIDAKRAEWLFNPGDQKPPAYFIPQDALIHISELYGVKV